MDQAESETYAHLQAKQREIAVRSLLTILDPHGDDAQQGYLEILRRAQNALAREFHQVRERGV